MADKLWKQAERKLAALLGGRRVPVSGRGRGDQPDIRHNIFSVEVKHRQELPSWLHDAMEQAEMSRRGDQIPLVILHEKGQKYEDSLTLVRFSSILELLKQLEA